MSKGIFFKKKHQPFNVEYIQTAYIIHFSELRTSKEL